MTAVSDTFMDRWRNSSEQVGFAAPAQMIELRRGRFYRGYDDWTFPEGMISSIDYGVMPTSPNNQAHKPWQATWTPTTMWETIPGLSSVTTQKDTTANNGIGQATITIENTEFLAAEGPTGDQYHTWDRGYLSPWRGFNPPGYSATGPQNEWYERLQRNSQIRIWQGYGTDVWVPTFVGLLDDADFDSGIGAGTNGGDQVILTARSFGRVLSDETLYGWNIDPALNDPIYFTDRGYADSNPGAVGDWWIKIDDISNIVRIILRWAGFKHWQVNDCGQGLNPGEPLSFNRGQYYIDVINQICALTGFVFWVGDPDPNDPESIGIPVFRYPRWYQPTSPIIEVHDAHLLTDAQMKITDDPRAYIIRVRGKIPSISSPIGLPLTINPDDQTDLDASVAAYENVVSDSGDPTKRPTYVYRPPWTVQNQEAGILKHVVHTDNYLVTIGDCRTACFLIAAAEALLAYTGQFQCPGNPQLELDTQVGIFDKGSGLVSRVYVSNVQTSFTWGVDQDGADTPFWYTTFSGSLLDTPDMLAIVDELNTANINGKPWSPAPALQG